MIGSCQVSGNGYCQRKILLISFILIFLFSCESEPHATQNIAQQQIMKLMERTTPGYEPSSIRLVDSILVDSSVFEKLKHWDETGNLTRLLYTRHGILDLPMTEEESADDQRDKRRTIPAFYVYDHSYRYTANGRTCLNADIFSYSTIKQKIYREDFRPVQLITKEPAFKTK